MINCAKALNNRGEKVLFVSANSERTSLIQQASFQHQKLQQIFKNDKNIELIQFNLQDSKHDGHGTLHDLVDLIKSKYNDCHIFIDEIHGLDPQMKYNQSIYDILINWTTTMDNDRHLWIVW